MAAKLKILLACDINGGIARRSTEPQLPWSGSNVAHRDRSFVAHQLSRKDVVVIIGRRTAELTPPSFWCQAQLVIVSQRGELAKTEYERIAALVKKRPDTRFATSFDAAVSVAMAGKPLTSVTSIYVMGGREIYLAALNSPFLSNISLCVFKKNYECDVFIPLPNTPFTVSMAGKHYEVRHYDLPTVEEQRYLNLCSYVLRQPLHPNRTAVQTRSVFHETLKFSLAQTDFAKPEGFRRIMPLLTCRRLSWKTVVTELLWFLRGETNVEFLNRHGVHIWDANSTAEFLKSRGLDYPPGELGPIYGAQWRNFGGIDQIKYVIEQLKANPWSRRLVVSAWNPPELHRMALPPCHYSFQFICTPLGGEKWIEDTAHINADGRGDPRPAPVPVLNCLVNMRSADLPLGVPFNIASYALLTHIVSLLTGIRPGRVSISMGDCHIYETHVPQVREIIRRSTNGAFPELVIDLPAGSPPLTIDDICEFAPDKFLLIGYNPREAMRLKMVV